jgi:hypothetical protein
VQPDDTAPGGTESAFENGRSWNWTPNSAW